MFKIKCKKCNKEMEGYNKKHAEYLLSRHMQTHKNKKVYLVFSLFLFIFLLNSVRAIDLYHCQEITRPGVYYLRNNITTNDDCFNILSDNVTINGNNFYLNCPEEEICVYAFDIEDSFNYSNIKITNVHIIGFDTAVSAFAVKNLELSRLSINVLSIGFDLANCSDVLIYNNQLNASYGDDSDEAISIGCSPMDNRRCDNIIIKYNYINDFYDIIGFYGNVNVTKNVTIYNNYFNSFERRPVFFGFDFFNGTNDGSIKFSVPPYSGRNIIGGSVISGNYWADRIGLGYSERCLGNIFCYCPYHFNNLSDEHPLTNNINKFALTCAQKVV